MPWCALSDNYGFPLFSVAAAGNRVVTTWPAAVRTWYITYPTVSFQRLATFP